MGLFFKSSKVYTVISVIDKHRNEVVYNVEKEGFFSSSFGPFMDNEIDQLCNRLKILYPSPQYEIEIMTMKD